MRLPFQKRSVDASDALTAALLAVAQGTDADPRRTAVVRACAGLVGRSLAQCTPTPAHDSITPHLLTQIGFELVTTGAALRLIDAGRLWEVEDVERGSRPDGTLSYRLRRKRPGQLQQGRKETHDEVAVIDIVNPSPVDRQSATFKALAAVEKVIAEDAASPHGQLLTGGTGIGAPIGTKAGIQLVAGIVRKLEGYPGGLMSVPGGYTAPGSPIHRVGLDPSEDLVKLRTALEVSCASALGVPPGLLLGGVGGGATRETHRYFTRSTVDPLARLAEAQLRKLVPGLTLDTARVGGRDVVSMARALKTLTEVDGMTLDEAKRLVGI